MCVNIGHGDQRVIKAIQEQAATLAYANPFMATEARARLGREAGARSARATSTSSSSPTAAPRPTRTRSRSRGWSPAATRSSRATARITAAPPAPDADRRSAPLGRGARHARRRPRAASVSRHPARHGTRRPTRSRTLEEIIQLEGPQTIAGVLPRDGHRHQRHPRAARRLPRRASATLCTSTASC